MTPGLDSNHLCSALSFRWLQGEARLLNGSRGRSPGRRVEPEGRRQRRQTRDVQGVAHHSDERRTASLPHIARFQFKNQATRKSACVLSQFVFCICAQAQTFQYPSAQSCTHTHTPKHSFVLESVCTTLAILFETERPLIKFWL